MFFVYTQWNTCESLCLRFKCIAKLSDGLQGWDSFNLISRRMNLSQSSLIIHSCGPVFLWQSFREGISHPKFLLAEFSFWILSIPFLVLFSLLPAPVMDSWEAEKSPPLDDSERTLVQGHHRGGGWRLVTKWQFSGLCAFLISSCGLKCDYGMCQHFIMCSISYKLQSFSDNHNWNIKQQILCSSAAMKGLSKSVLSRHSYSWYIRRGVLVRASLGRECHSFDVTTGGKAKCFPAITILCQLHGEKLLLHYDTSDERGTNILVPR